MAGGVADYGKEPECPVMFPHLIRREAGQGRCTECETIDATRRRPGPHERIHLHSALSQTPIRAVSVHES